MMRLDSNHKGKNRDGMTAELCDTLGTSTGESEHALTAGGWAGTDDASSTAPSDQIGIAMSEDQKPLHVIAHDFDESIAVEEEEQRERAANSDEASEISSSEEESQREKWHRLAAKVRAARKRTPGKKAG